MDFRKVCLVVEDDPIIRLDLVDIAEDAGFATEEISNADEALRRLQFGIDPHVDLLMTDIGLPGSINGEALAQAARDLHPSIKICIVTGHDPQRVSLPSDVALIQKPFSRVALQQLLRTT